MQRYIWKAYYNDGSIKSQLDINPETGRELSSDHLPDQHLIKAIVLEPQFCNVPKVSLQIKSGEQFKRFWVQYIDVGPLAQRTCWVLQLTVRSHHYADPVDVYTFIRPDGSIVVSTDPEGSEFNI